MGTFRMPSLGADMEHGTIVEWRVRPGDRVERGQIVAVVDTEKADIEIEVFEAGVIGELLVGEGVEVPVGTPIATIETTATLTAEVSHPPPPHHAAPHVRSPLVRHLADELHVDLARVEPGADGVVHRDDVERTARSAHAPSAAPVAPVPSSLRASPRARRLAAEHGIDLAAIPVTHPDGARHAADVERAVRTTPTTPRTSVRGQDAVARLMARSKREIPHYYLAHEVDVEDALRWCEARNATRPVEQRVLPAALLLRAVVLGCRAVPECNGHHLDGGFVPGAHVDLGVAVSARDGSLLAPVIPAAETLDLDGLMGAMRGVVARARARALRAGDTTPATITVTSLGDQGVDAVQGVIVPPQVAIVGFGAVAPRARVHEGVVAVRRTVTVTLAADHRVSHGHRGARFLRAVADALERPEDLA